MSDNALDKAKALDKSSRKEGKREFAKGLMITSLGVGLLCVLVGIVSIGGIQEYNSSRPSRRLMSQLLSFLGDKIGSTGGSILIVVGIVVVLAGLVNFLAARRSH